MRNKMANPRAELDRKYELSKKRMEKELFERDLNEGGKELLAEMWREWRKFQKDNPQFSKTVGKHHYFRSRLVMGFFRRFIGQKLIKHN